MTSVIKPVLEVDCEGDPYDIGLKLGASLREKIHWACKALPQFELFRLLRPWWMPLAIYKRCARWQARHALEPLIAQLCPHIQQRLRGMAEGAEISLDSLYLLHSLETATIPMAAGPPGATFAGCSTIAVRGRRSATGEPIIAHNFDSVPLVQPTFVVRRRHGCGECRSLEFTAAPLSGVIDGINERGLCIVYNFAMATDVSRPGLPLSMLVDDALARCATVREAVRQIRRGRRGGGGILMLADASGDLAALELSSKRSRVRRPKRGSDLLFHTNRFRCKKTRRAEAPRDTVFGSGAPAQLRGIRVHQSSEQRDKRLQELLHRPLRLGPVELLEIMSDHGPDDEASGDTVCMHGSHWRTTACLQLLPASRRIRIAYEAACRAEFEEIELSR